MIGYRELASILPQLTCDNLSQHQEEIKQFSDLTTLIEQIFTHSAFTSDEIHFIKTIINSFEKITNEYSTKLTEKVNDVAKMNLIAEDPIIEGIIDEIAIAHALLIQIQLLMLSRIKEINHAKFDQLNRDERVVKNENEFRLKFLKEKNPTEGIGEYAVWMEKNDFYIGFKSLSQFAETVQRVDLYIRVKIRTDESIEKVIKYYLSDGLPDNSWDTAKKIQFENRLHEKCQWDSSIISYSFAREIAETLPAHVSEE